MSSRHGMNGALTRVRFRAITALFAVSGVAGLVDQVCFSKYLSYVVGATAYAVSAVLAAFMTGLTIGAAVGGRLSGKVKRPLAAYGAAEVVVGVAVSLTPLAFRWLTPLYVSAVSATHGSLTMVSVLRWLAATSIVIVPTIAMGATLPLLSRALAEPAKSAPAGPGETAAESGDEAWALRVRERRLSVLYAANTFGGAAGALIGAYLALPVLGLSKTLYAAASLSVATGAIAFYLSRGKEPSRVSPREPSPASGEEETAVGAGALTDAGALWLFVLSFGSGALAFMMEVVATHLLAVIIGNSAYAFGLILAAFLTCLFVGAAATPRFSRVFGPAALSVSLGLTAGALALTTPLWDDLPLVFGGLGAHITTFAGREAMRGVVAFGVLALPVMLMGLTFPLILRRAAASPDVGRLVGRFAAINTIGAVVGALVTGYVVLPALGSERSLLVACAAFALLSLATAVRPESASRFGRKPLALAAVALALPFVLPRWDMARLTSGTNVYFDGPNEPNTLLSVREDVYGGITTVTDTKGVRTLYTNGKFQGNDGWEFNAQRYFAHYPSLFVHHFDGALVIGFGTGTTLGTLATYPWKRLDLLEISPAIVDASRRYFGRINRDVLDDPRVHVTIDDARNHLLTHDRRYDLISMELSSVWFAGASSLYSSEYYRLVHAHLREAGVFQQWVQLHHVYRPVFARLVNTLRREFDHVALFVGGGQGILVASERPLTWSRERSSHLEERPDVHETLPYGRPLESLPADIALMDDGLDRFLADSAKEAGIPLERFVSTDDNLVLEYETPRGNTLPWSAREALVATLRTYRDERAIAAMEEAPGSRVR